MIDKSIAGLERERVAELQAQRSFRIGQWSQARNVGVQEGLLMAVTALVRLSVSDETILEVVKCGDRHFGHEMWEGRPNFS